MGRKRKSGLDVCPFDVNMLSDIRMRRLIRLHQGDAIAVYMASLCLIYRGGYYVRYDEDARLKLSEQTGVDEATVDAIIVDAVACGLFDSEVFTSDRVLTSQEIQEAYLEERRKVSRRKSSLESSDFALNGSAQNTDNATQKEHNASQNSGIAAQNSDFAEEMSQNTDNATQNAVNDENEAISPVPVAHTQEDITHSDVVDNSDSTLELFNTPVSSNNLYNQEKEKTRQKEKEAELALPYCSAEFVSTWELLKKQPKWKKKTKSALQMSLNKLSKYPEEFAIVLMENAIAGNYQGVVFTWTPEAYRKWEAERCGVPLPSGNKKPKDIYTANIESMNEAFRLIDEKYGGKKYGT